MNLQGERTIPAPVEQTWLALNDPETLKACINGCESIEPVGENQFVATMGVKIGPVNAKFKGKLQLTDVVPMESYKINFEGQGGVAGFGKGSATVALSPVDQTTLLKYEANAQVGGKIAQVGSRLVDSAASKIAEDFFKAFGALMAERAAAAGVAPAAGTDTGSTGAAMSAIASTAASAAQATQATPGAPALTPAGLPDQPGAGGSRFWWIVALVVLAIVAFVALRR